MRARRRGQAPAALHDHNVTEASLQLGELALSFHTAGPLCRGPSQRATCVVYEDSLDFLHLNMSVQPPSGAPLGQSGGEVNVSLTTMRWRRLVVRMERRLDWAKRGVMLVLVKRPDLRWLPYPYPFISSPAACRSQAESMTQSGAWPRKWLGCTAFTAGGAELFDLVRQPSWRMPSWRTRSCWGCWR